MFLQNSEWARQELSQIYLLLFNNNNNKNQIDFFLTLTPHLSCSPLHWHGSPSGWVSKPHFRLPLHICIVTLYSSHLSSNTLHWITLIHSFSPQFHLSSDTHMRLPLHMDVVLILVGLWHQHRSTLPNESPPPVILGSNAMPWATAVPSSSSAETSLVLSLLMDTGLIVQEGKRKKRKLGRENIAAFLNR